MSKTVWAANEKLQEALDIKYRELQDDEGMRYASVMEGYGNLVSAMNSVESYFKECKRSVNKFGVIVNNTSPDAQREVLEAMEREAAILTTAGMVMAARMRLFRDTVVDISGGNLLDMLGGLEDPDEKIESNEEDKNDE